MVVKVCGFPLISPNAVIRSLPTKTTPRATVGWLYLPPGRVICAVVLANSFCIVVASIAKRVGGGALVRESPRYTFGSSTQMIALSDPLLLITGVPGLLNSTDGSLL